MSAQKQYKRLVPCMPTYINPDDVIVVASRRGAEPAVRKFRAVAVRPTGDQSVEVTDEYGTTMDVHPDHDRADWKWELLAIFRPVVDPLPVPSVVKDRDGRVYFVSSDGLRVARDGFRSSAFPAKASEYATDQFEVLWSGKE